MRETLVEQWMRRVWNERDEAAVAELFAADGVAYGLAGELVRGPAEFRAFRAAMFQAFARIEVEVLEQIENGEHVACRCRSRLWPNGEGEAVEMLGMCFLQVRDGQIRVAHNYWDFLGALEGLGLLPSGSFGRAISGQLDPHPQVEG